MTTGFENNFVFLSELIHLAVLDAATNTRIGRLVDIVAGLREMYPRMNALVIRGTKRRGKLYIPWENVKAITPGGAIVVDSSAGLPFEGVKLHETDILLRETFWDKQVVDISGAKVIRVNDLHLLREDRNMWLIHMDVGVTGLIRRLGWSRWVNFILKWLFSFELKDRFISWKLVQPVTGAIETQSLALKVHHSRLSELLPADLADIIVNIGTDERITILTSLDHATAADTFQKLPPRIQMQISESINHEQLGEIVNEMAIDKVVDLFAQLPSRKVHSFYPHMPVERVAEIHHLLGHSEHAAGSIMTTAFICARHDETSGMLLDRIKQGARKKLFIYYIYVLGDDDSLAGIVTLFQILAAPAGTRMSELMRKRVTRVTVDTNIKEVAEVFYKYDFVAVPVVDDRNRIQGIIPMKAAFGAVFRKIRDESLEAQR